MDDISEKINQLFSDPNSMQQIKNLAGMLSGSGMGNQNNNAAQNAPQNNNFGFGGMNMNKPTQPPSSSNQSEDMPNIDPAMIMKLSSAMQMMNRPDPRVDLLRALKENLSDARQKKVDDAIKILRLLSLMPVLQEQGIFNLFG